MNTPVYEKTCPHCAEVIKAAAVVCRYCQRDLKSVENRQTPKKSRLVECDNCGSGVLAIFKRQTEGFCRDCATAAGFSFVESAHASAITQEALAIPQSMGHHLISGIHNQRIAIAAISGLGIISTFLPWAHAGMLTVTGTQGDGWITLALFLPGLLLLLSGTKTESLTYTTKIGISIPAAIAVVIGVYKISEFQSRIDDLAKSNTFGSLISVSTRIGIGLYLLVAAGVGIIAIACFFFRRQEANEEIQDDSSERNMKTAFDYQRYNYGNQIGYGTWAMALALLIGIPAVVYATVLKRPNTDEAVSTRVSGKLGTRNVGHIGAGGAYQLSSNSIVSRSQYDQICQGMSYRDVKRIIGTSGEEISSNYMEGVPGVMKSIKTQMYQWSNTGGSNMNAMFQNDRLISKAQFGLK